MSGEFLRVIVLDENSSALDVTPLLEATSASVCVTPKSQLDSVVRQGVDVLIGETIDMVEIVTRLDDTVHRVGIGDPRLAGLDPSVRDLDCILLSSPDASTLHGALTRSHVSADNLVREILPFSVFGQSLPEALHELARRLASGFGADECVVLLPQEATCYLVHHAQEAIIADLARLCESVHQFETTVIAPPRPGRPYRAFLGLPLAHDTAPPLAFVLLCRREPVPFGRSARSQFDAVARRLATDLSWRLAHERLLADREKLRGLSSVDPVLGVASRTALETELPRRIAESQRHGEPFAVAVIDVDGLRLVNERNGYPAGDAVLAHIARIASQHTTSNDLVARYAGGAIALVLPRAHVDAAHAVLTRILGAIDETPVVYEDRAINLTVSAGIAQLTGAHDTGDAALARAAVARERARMHGEVIAVADDLAADVRPHSDFRIGSTLGGVFQIRHEISGGAFGVVYRAEDLALGRQVALKLLRADLARDAAFVERFRSEAALLARIRHPNLVQVYAFGLDGADVYFAMELVEGQGLDKRIRSARQRRRHLPLHEVISVIEQVADALEAVHRAGIVHRDVKPENVLIDRVHRRCVLVDVGIAVRRGEKNSAGTPGFTAPEIFSDRDATPASDVYSLAVLAYVLMTLEEPFGGGSPVQVLSRQLMSSPEALTTIRPDLPAEVNDILLPALDPDPTRRQHGASALSKMLSDVLVKPGVSPRLTVESQPGAQPKITVFDPTHRAVTTTSTNTRGVMFRAAYEALGRRGGESTENVARKLPELAAAIAPQAMMSWYPTSMFITLLQTDTSDETERRAIAMHAGRLAAELSFRQFYGADPCAVGPGPVLRATEAFWPSYHGWGRADVNVMEQGCMADVTLCDGLADTLLCASTAGLLAGILASTGAEGVEVLHPQCVAEGSTCCRFRVSWSLPDP